MVIRSSCKRIDIDRCSGRFAKNRRGRSISCIYLALYEISLIRDVSKYVSKYIIKQDVYISLCKIFRHAFAETALIIYYSFVMLHPSPFGFFFCRNYHDGFYFGLSKGEFFSRSKAFICMRMKELCAYAVSSHVTLISLRKELTHLQRLGRTIKIRIAD